MPGKAPTREAQTRTAQEGSPQPRIFLAHASEDKAQVRQLYDDLKARGFDPWLDEVDLIPGQVWPVEIPKAIRQAGLFLACLSSRSVGKQGYVQSEFRTALATYGERPPGSIWLIPVKLDDCEIPDLQIPDRGLSLRDIHWLDLGHENGFEQLVSAIEFALPKATSTSAESDPETLSPLRGPGRPTGVIDVSSLPDPPEDTNREPPPSGIEPASISDREDQSGGDEIAADSNARTNLLHRLRSSVAERFSPRQALGVVSIAVLAAVAGSFVVPWPGLSLKPGDVFRDCDECPEMVVVPAGLFRMGSGENEVGRFLDEGPQRMVTIAEPFAIGKYEVTFAEWDACVAGGGCARYRPSDIGWGRGLRPVINVFWHDAQAYISWLSNKSSQAYRLPSEAEWEYAARAGTTTRFSWGNHINPDDANYGGNVGATAEAGSYPANPWGLHDMHGNVWEWVEDCWNNNYEGAPVHASAWETGNCSRRVVRGGSWNSEARNLRSAVRGVFDTGFRVNHLGFRVARTLTP